MKVNPLLSEILRGQWLMQPQYLMGVGQIVAGIVAGEEVEFDRYTGMLSSIYDKDGARVAMEWDSDTRTFNAEIPEGSVAVVNMKGAVIKYGDFCTWGADEIVAALHTWNEVTAIKGIILNIDGPGGSVNAIGPFLEFAGRKTKPVVGLIDLAASLHYWTAVAVCDHLMTDNNVSAMVGSVGVVVSFADTKPMYEKMGIKFHEIYPPESEEKNSSFNLALEGKYDKIIKEHLSPIAQKFQAAVRAGRPNLIEEKGVLTGRTFFADEALEYGMIDSIGSLNKAMQTVDSLAFKRAVNQI